VWRLRRILAPHRFDKLGALLAQYPLHAADGVTFPVEQMLDAAKQFDVVRTIIAASAAALHRLDFAKPALPKAQNMLRQVEFVSDFADSAKCIGRLAIQSERSFWKLT
jgi:hypothetical protein